MTRVAAVGLALVAGLFIPAAGGDKAGDKERWKKFLPDDAFKVLVEREAKIIQKSLEGDPDKEHLSRARGGAAMIMLFAECHEKPSPSVEAQGKIAQEIARTLPADAKLDQARKLVDDFVKGKVDI